MFEQFKVEKDSLEFIVIDEADKMFEMGFLEQIDGILSNCYVKKEGDNEIITQRKISKFLFSATMQPGVEEIVKSIMEDPIKITVGIKNSTASTID